MKEVDVAVVGAGPAGLAAAVEASRAGARVLILEESRRIGGRVFGHDAGPGKRHAGYLADLWRRLRSELVALEVPIVHNAAVWNVSDERVLDVSTPSGPL